MNKIKNNWFIYLVALLLVILVGYSIWSTQTQKVQAPIAEEEVREEVVKEMEEEEEPVEKELIRVDSPQPNQTIKSPLTFTGEASGTWFFEGSFPVSLLDGDGNSLATGSAQAQGDWMTEDLVAFRGEFEFSVPETESGVIIFEKSNPSGLPQFAEGLQVPVGF